MTRASEFEYVSLIDPATGIPYAVTSGSGGTSMTDDAAFTAGSSSFTPAGGIVTADSVDSGDGGAFAMLANRQQKVTLYDSSGVELAVGGGTQYTEDDAAAANPVGNALMMVRDDALSGQTTTDGDNVAARGTDKGELYVKHVDGIAVTGTVDLGATDNAVLDAIAASVAAGATAAKQDTQTTALGTLLTTAAHDAAFGTAGTADAQVRSIQGIASMTPVQVSQATAANLNVTEASAAAIAASLSVVDDWDNGASDGASISGDVAHDSADAGEPVKIGFRAYSPDGTTPGTAVAENDRTNGKSDLDGLLYVSHATPRAWHYHDDDAAAVTTDGTLQADPGDGFAVFIETITMSIGAATASTLFIEEGSTKIWGPHNLPATIGAGFSIKCDPPLRCTASTAILITNTGSINFAIDVDGFVSAV